MNIKDAMGIANLRDTVVAKQQPDLIQVGDLIKKLRQVDSMILAEVDKLSSKQFMLVMVDTNKVASPGPRCDPKVVNQLMASEDKGIVPIVIDVNKNKLGKVGTGYIPNSIVISGREHFEAAVERGDTIIAAWVGVACKPFLPTKPYKHPTSTQSTPINQRRNDFKGPISTPNTQIPGAISSVLAMQEIQACPECNGTCKDAMHSELDDVVAEKDGEKCTMRMCKDMYAKMPDKKKLYASAPSGKGWEHITKKLKTVPGIDNPWALAHWMKNEGYKPSAKSKSMSAGGPGSGRYPKGSGDQGTSTHGGYSDGTVKHSRILNKYGYRYERKNVSGTETYNKENRRTGMDHTVHVTKNGKWQYLDPKYSGGDKKGNDYQSLAKHLKIVHGK